MSTGRSGISWEAERRHFGFYPAALLEDLTNVVLDCRPPSLALSNRSRSLNPSNRPSPLTVHRPVHWAGHD